eukprot:8784896-Prorocentrum_lima.AAC.1
MKPSRISSKLALKRHWSPTRSRGAFSWSCLSANVTSWGQLRSGLMGKLLVAAIWHCRRPNFVAWMQQGLQTTG